MNPHRARAVAHLRRSFRVDRPVVRARLYVTALGVYEARLNGEPAGDALLSPGWTDYAKRLDYQVYDVTALVRQGPNVLGALLGEGWYSGYLGFYPQRPRHIYGTEPQFRARLVLDFADGPSVSVATDASWRVGRADRASIPTSSRASSSMRALPRRAGTLPGLTTSAGRLPARALAPRPSSVRRGPRPCG